MKLGRGRLLTRFTAAAAAGLGLVAAAVLMAPAASVSSAAGAAKPVVFTVGITNEVDSFNPFDGVESESYEMWALMYDYMISYSNKDLSPAPALAKSWDTSKDGLTWTFHIRTGVKWSDGKDLTAHDIAYTYNRILDGGPEAASWASYLASVAKVTAPNDTTVVLKLDKPNAVLPLLPMPIIPEHIWKNVKESEVKTYANENDPVGSGPFRLVHGKAGGPLYQFVPNRHYWRGVSPIDQLNFRVCKAEDPLVQSLKAGDVDFAEDISPLQVKALQGEAGITAQMGASPGFEEIAFNTGSKDPKTEKPIGDPNPAVQDPKFRFALNFAINRQEIADKAFQGGAAPATTIVPSTYPQYQWKSPDPKAFAYDPAKARQLLDAAGYKVGSDGFRTLPDGKPIGTLRLFARSDSETSVSTENFLKEWLHDVQIDSKVTAFESSKLTNVILDGDFDIFDWGWYVDPDPDSMLSYFTCAQRGGWSDSWYCNPVFDRLYARQHSQLDQAKREAEIKRMQKILYRDAPYLVTVYDKTGEAYRSDRFHGFVPQPNPGGVLLFQYGVRDYIHLKVGPATSDGGVSSAGSSGQGIQNTTAVIVLIVAGLCIFAMGASLGGWAGYRKATVDYRE
jgi:peptide/nickel transport system substrate-binding protein